MTMNTNKTLSAYFSNLLVKNNRDNYYETVQAACYHSEDGDIIKTTMSRFVENVTFDRNMKMTLSGAYSDDFSTLLGHTLIKGSLTIITGEISINYLTIL
jgi:hypothetical protein